MIASAALARLESKNVICKARRSGESDDQIRTIYCHKNEAKVEVTHKRGINSADLIFANGYKPATLSVEMSGFPLLENFSIKSKSKNFSGYIKGSGAGTSSSWVESEDSSESKDSPATSTGDLKSADQKNQDSKVSDSRSPDSKTSSAVTSTGLSNNVSSGSIEHTNGSVNSASENKSSLTRVSNGFSPLKFKRIDKRKILVSIPCSALLKETNECEISWIDAYR